MNFFFNLQSLNPKTQNKQEENNDEEEDEDDDDHDFERTQSKFDSHDENRDDDDIGRMIYKMDDSHEQDDQENAHPSRDEEYLQQYYSNGEGHKKTSDDDDQDEEGKPQSLSLSDLEAPASNQIVHVEYKEPEEEKPEFYSNNYWKVESGYDIEKLLSESQ